MPQSSFSLIVDEVQSNITDTSAVLEAIDWLRRIWDWLAVRGLSQDPRDPVVLPFWQRLGRGLLVFLAKIQLVLVT